MLDANIKQAVRSTLSKLYVDKGWVCDWDRRPVKGTIFQAYKLSQVSRSCCEVARSVVVGFLQCDSDPDAEELDRLRCEGVRLDWFVMPTIYNSTPRSVMLRYISLDRVYKISRDFRIRKVTSKVSVGKVTDRHCELSEGLKKKYTRKLTLEQRYVSLSQLIHPFGGS